MKRISPLRLAGYAAMLAFLNQARSQPLIQWQKCLGGTAADNANTVRQTLDGGYIMAGTTNSTNGDVTGNHGGADVWLVKLSSSGTIAWQKAMGGTGDDLGYDVRQTSDGGYIVAGYTGSNNGDVTGYHGLRDGWVVKLDATGTIQWQKSLGGSSFDELYSVVQTSDGGYAVTGYTGSTNGDVSGNHGTYDGWVVKLDNTGSIQWQKCIGGSVADFGYAIRQTTDGGYIVAANTKSNNGDVSGNHGSDEAWMVKLDNTGTLQWQKCLGGTGSDFAYATEQTTDGGYIMAGQTASNNGDVSGKHGGKDAWVVKLNSSGTPLWQKCLGGSADEAAYSIRPLAAGGYAMAGTTKSNDGDVSGNHGNDDAWLVNMDGTGNLVWQKCMGGTAAEGSYTVDLTSDGFYAVAGSAASGNGDVSGNHGGGDAWVVKLGCGNQVVVNITTDANPGQLSWELRDSGLSLLASGAPTVANGLNSTTVCLEAFQSNSFYNFKLMDSFGDGITNGGWELRTTTGKLILKDVFANGNQSPSATPASPGYGSAHSFSLPLGTANIAATECGIFNNLPGNKVYCNKVTGATQYQFEFSDPDAGFLRRIVRTTNYVRFWDMVSNPLVPGVHYFGRVRSNVAGPLASAHWGSGCEMGLAPTVPCSGLIPAPNYGHSCNETRSFNTNNSFIYATPVPGASQYQFRIYNTGEGYDQTFTRNTYILQLKWSNIVAPPLLNGSTYNVEINVNVGGVWSGFCPSSCTITINNPPSFARMAQTAAFEATLWPNPVRDGQVHLDLGGLGNAEQYINADVLGIDGRQVWTGAFGNSGDHFRTTLQLPADLAAGTYVVNITANGVKLVKQLSIVH
ncbi:MAG: T9SS type A sorting domain-containing protein [Bacteroidetes bacterium]|nr:T9SS type A sorting domain-containing protein [Bacteroidota bacterium]